MFPPNCKGRFNSVYVYNVNHLHQFVPHYATRPKWSQTKEERKNWDPTKEEGREFLLCTSSLRPFFFLLFLLYTQFSSDHWGEAWKRKEKGRAYFFWYAKGKGLCPILSLLLRTFKVTRKKHKVAQVKRGESSNIVDKFGVLQALEAWNVLRFERKQTNINQRKKQTKQRRATQKEEEYKERKWNRYDSFLSSE